MKQKRYGVTEPIEGGYSYFNVFDRDSNVMPNFTVATFSNEIPTARDEANGFCDRLNFATAK